MYLVALKMLIGDRVKYLGLIFGIMFASFLMSQQVSLFLSLLNRTASQIEEITEADIWVMSPQVRYVDEIIALNDFDLYRVRGVDGVKWAVPLYKGSGIIKTYNGSTQQVIIMGLDDYSFVGRPPKMLEGKWEDIKLPDALIMDKAGWEYIWPGSKFQHGREIELNDRRAQIVGLCQAAPPFMTFPIVFTKFSNALKYIPQGRKRVPFVIVKAEGNIDPKLVARNITKHTKLQALTSQEFKERSIHHYLTRTGIPINFGITVTLGFIVGASIAAQTFYIFIIENLKAFGALKAIGVNNRQILTMVILQAAVVGIIGFSLGIGLTAIFFKATANVTALRGFYLRGIVVVWAALAVALIMLVASYASIKKVFKLDPAVVFRG
jgi:putative ABC transport system permease protein